MEQSHPVIAHTAIPRIHCTAMTAKPDSNLVFAMLALQLDYIDQAQLIDAANAWMLDKSQSFGSVLVRRNLIA